MNDVKEQAAMLPDLPGVYKYFNANGEIIYVGKAKNLRRRVMSYFVDSASHSVKVRVLVRQIARIEHIVVAHENDALLLENNLIKTLQPRYNAMLKDDKTYPWIVIRNEPFPRVESTRKVVHDGSQYFGPYASLPMQKHLLEFIHTIYPLRTCKLNLSPEAVARGKYDLCLQYHIGNCRAPCKGLQQEEDYNDLIRMVAQILRGDLRTTRRYLEGQMARAAEQMRYEAAAAYKAKLDRLEEYHSKSVVVSSATRNMDVFALVVDADAAYCNFTRIVQGAMVNSFTVELSTGVEQEPVDLLTLAIQEIYTRIEGGGDGGRAPRPGLTACAELPPSADRRRPVGDKPAPVGELASLGSQALVVPSAVPAPEVVVPFMPHQALFPGVKFVVPQRGDKLKLLQFSERGAKLHRLEKMKNLEIKDPARHTDRIMEAMRKALRLSAEPRHIECFDNSNLQGTNPVAACVVFRDGKPSRKEYRHFNVKTVVGADDFATMREIIHRRYRRVLDEGGELPDLIVVDGGKGQLSSAYAVLQELGIAERVPIIGLAKRIEEVFYPNDPLPYYLERGGEPLKVIMHIRDEAHRFGITFHRQKRSAAFIRSELEAIPGLGRQSVDKLLKRFRTVAAIRKASAGELAETVGAARAAAIAEYFSETK